MKKLILAVAFISLFAACDQNKEFRDPNIVAQKFLDDYINMNYESSKKYASADFIEILEQYNEEKNLLSAEVIAEAEKSTVEIKNMEIKEAEGIAYAKFSNSQIPDIVDQLELRKVEDKWLAHNVERTVDVELDDMFPDDEIEKMMEEAEEQEETIPTETIE